MKAYLIRLDLAVLIVSAMQTKRIVALIYLYLGIYSYLSHVALCGINRQLKYAVSLDQGGTAMFITVQLQN